MKPDINKVRAGLEHCSAPDVCDGCPYMERPEGQQGCGMFAEALALLKAQEPRVLTLEELSGIYVEFKDDFFLVSLICFDLQKIIGYMQDGSCRLWSSKPSFEQRKAVKWDE